MITFSWLIILRKQFVNLLHLCNYTAAGGGGNVGHCLRPASQVSRIWRILTNFCGAVCKSYLNINLLYLLCYRKEIWTLKNLNKFKFPTCSPHLPPLSIRLNIDCCNVTTSSWSTMICITSLFNVTLWHVIEFPCVTLQNAKGLEREKNRIFNEKLMVDDELERRKRELKQCKKVTETNKK